MFIILRLLGFISKITAIAQQTFSIVCKYNSCFCLKILNCVYFWYKLLCRFCHIISTAVPQNKIPKDMHQADKLLSVRPPNNPSSVLSTAKIFAVICPAMAPYTLPMYSMVIASTIPTMKA